eukprot:6183204-Pleurochrysis_carterae.AAC.2
MQRLARILGLIHIYATMSPGVSAAGGRDRVPCFRVSTGRSPTLLLSLAGKHYFDSIDNG